MSVWLSVVLVKQISFDCSRILWFPRSAWSILNLCWVFLLVVMGLINLGHLFTCKKGGLIVRDHNEVHDCIENLSSLAWGQVVTELMVKECTSDGTHGTLTDLGVHNVWQRGIVWYTCFYTDAHSYLSNSPLPALVSAENEKREHSLACSDYRASFIPLCFSMDIWSMVSLALRQKHLAFEMGTN